MYNSGTHTARWIWQHYKECRSEEFNYKVRIDLLGLLKHGSLRNYLKKIDKVPRGKEKGDSQSHCPTVGEAKTRSRWQRQVQ